MSEVNSSDTRAIESCDDVIETYEGAGEAMKTGIEVELAFFDPATPDLTPMNVAQNKAARNAANTQYGDDFARNEPTAEMLEIGSKAGAENEIKNILTDTQAKVLALTSEAENIGLKRSYFQHLPNKTADDLLKNLMDVDRYQAFFGPPRGDILGIAHYFCVCKSNQVSISYKDHDHMLTNIRRLYTLAPFLFLALDNNPPFDQNRAFADHAGMSHRTSLGDRGGIPPYVFTAKTGEEYIRDHIEHVMNNPLFVYYDENGKMIRVPDGEWESFNHLKERGLNTATNYYFSESILWPDVKIAALKNSDGEVNGHRYEARMLGVGLHQNQTSLLIVAALAFDQNLAAKTDELLAQYGLGQSDGQTLKAPLQSAYKAAQTHGGKFMDIAYGTGSMLEFAKAFAELLENSEFMNPYAAEIAPFLTICRTGFTDSKVNAILFDTMEKAIEFQRGYDPQIFENPEQCAYDLFGKQLSTNAA